MAGRHTAETRGKSWACHGFQNDCSEAPHLYTIFDVWGNRMLGEKGRVLVPVWDAMQDSHFVAAIRNMRSISGLPDSLSLLRVFDVATVDGSGKETAVRATVDCHRAGSTNETSE